MDYKKAKASGTTIPRNLDILYGETGNVYETVMILAKRANQISSELKEELNQKLQEFASHGTGIVMISSDLSELIGMCDRILVMHQGILQGEALRKDFSEELILSYAAGINGKAD